MKIHSLKNSLLILGAGVFLSACSHTGSPTPPAGGAPTAGVEVDEADEAVEKENGDTMMAEATVTIKDFAYTPATLTVKAGEKFTVKNLDLAGHSVTSDDGTSFDTGVLSKDQSMTLTAPTKPGTYKFHCTPHPSITGTLVVE